MSAEQWAVVENGAAAMTGRTPTGRRLHVTIWAETTVTLVRDLLAA